MMDLDKYKDPPELAEIYSPSLFFRELGNFFAIRFESELRKTAKQFTKKEDEE